MTMTFCGSIALIKKQYLPQKHYLGQRHFFQTAFVPKTSVLKRNLQTLSLGKVFKVEIGLFLGLKNPT
jgi:hypothetical protein